MRSTGSGTSPGHPLIWEDSVEKPHEEEQEKESAKPYDVKLNRGTQTGKSRWRLSLKDERQIEIRNQAWRFKKFIHLLLFNFFRVQYSALNSDSIDSYKAKPVCIQTNNTGINILRNYIEESASNLNRFCVSNWKRKWTQWTVCSFCVNADGSMGSDKPTLTNTRTCYYM